MCGSSSKSIEVNFDELRRVPTKLGSNKIGFQQIQIEMQEMTEMADDIDEKDERDRRLTEMTESSSKFVEVCQS